MSKLPPKKLRAGLSMRYGAARLAVLLFLMAVGPADAASVVWSYTMEEMYDRAVSYKLVMEGKAPTDLNSAMLVVEKSGEFKGYIAGFLDQMPDDSLFGDCARKLPVGEISRRAAIVMTSAPLDRSGIAKVAVLVTMGRSIISIPNLRQARIARRG